MIEQTEGCYAWSADWNIWSLNCKKQSYQFASHSAHGQLSVWQCSRVAWLSVANTSSSDLEIKPVLLLFGSKSISSHALWELWTSQYLWMLQHWEILSHHGLDYCLRILDCSSFHLVNMRGSSWKQIFTAWNCTSSNHLHISRYTTTYNDHLADISHEHNLIPILHMLKKIVSQ